MEGIEIVPGDEAVDSDGCNTDVDEDERETEELLGDDALLVAAHLNFLDPDTKVINEDEARSVQQKIDMKELCRGYALLSKASKLQSRGYSIISSVLQRNPEMSVLSSTLAGVKIEGVGQREGQSVSQGYKPVPVVKAGVVSAPKSIKGQKGFFCRFCNEQFTVWETADSHTRRFHTGEFYVCGCQAFKTPNRSSLRQHRKVCKAMKGESGSVKLEKVEGL